MNNFLDLSIIILSYKQKGLVKQSLKRLKNLNLSLNYEIIVVDNNSHDGIENVIEQEFLNVKLIKAKSNNGYAAGNNLGISKAQGKYILILNPDVAVLPKAIEKLYNFMENHPQSGIAGPKVLNADKTLQHTCSIFPDWRLPFYRRTFLGKTKLGQKWNDNYLMKGWNHKQDRQVDWLFGACLMVRKKAIEEVGLLDERFFLYMEDLDWCRRFWEKGWQVWYVVEAKVIHFHQRMSADVNIFWSLFSKSARVHLISWLKYFLKYKNHKILKNIK